MQGKTILIVGARSVIATSLAKQFKEAGADLILTSSIASENFKHLDLNDSASIKTFLDSMTGIKLDGIVITSGLVAFGPVDSTPIEVVNRLMQVNALGPIEVITGLVENLKLGEDSFVVTLSGKIAEIPTAGMAAYSASKAALYSYSIAAGRELRRSGIRWIDARPGHTETGLAGRAIHGTAPAFGTGLEPELVGKRIFEAIQNGEKDLPSSAFETI